MFGCTIYTAFEMIQYCKVKMPKTKLNKTKTTMSLGRKILLKHDVLQLLSPWESCNSNLQSEVAGLKFQNFQNFQYDLPIAIS